MKIIGLMLCRNSDWILGLSARAALMWCDGLVIYNHSSHDRTKYLIRDLLVENPQRVMPMQFFHPRFVEMEMRNDMLCMARHGTRRKRKSHEGYERATHIALIDDDEVLSGNLLPNIRDMVEETPKGSVLMLPWLQVVNAINEPTEWGVMTSGHWGRSPVSVAFPDLPELHWASQAGGYDHHHRHPMGREFSPFSPLADRTGGLMHFQFASRRRLLAKQFWYQLQERLRWPDRAVKMIRETYSFTVEESAAAKVETVPAEWFEPYAHLMQHLHLDREPWQESECKRLLAQNPGIAEGLNDFGLLKKWGIS